MLSEAAAMIAQRKSKCHELAAREIQSTHAQAATKICAYMFRASQAASRALLPTNQKAVAKKIRVYLLQVVKDLQAKNTRTVGKHDRCLKEALEVKPKRRTTKPKARAAPKPKRRLKEKTPTRTTKPKARAAPKPRRRLKEKTPTRTTKPRARATPAQKNKTWRWILDQWKRGRELPKIKGSVFWETSRCTQLGNSKFRQKKTPASGELPMSSLADSSPFRAHLKGRRSATSFPNLGKNATLVSPADKGKNFSHIGNFYKHASEAEMKDFWETVAKAVEKRIKLGESVYVSTHGTGVNWLHVRIEATPKYYVSDLK